MSWDTNVYYHPEKFGLIQIGHIDDPEASYSFDDLIVWHHDDGRVFYAQDSGCSCPTPFEDFDSLDDLTEVTQESWGEFEKDVLGHCLPGRWYNDDEQEERVDPQGVDKVDLLRKVEALIR